MPRMRDYEEVGVLLGQIIRLLFVYAGINTFVTFVVYLFWSALKHTFLPGIAAPVLSVWLWLICIPVMMIVLWLFKREC